jgi:Putative zinc-finger
MKLKLDCKDVSRLISDGQDQELPATERARLRLHFVICETCRNVDEQMQFIRRAMKKLGDEEKRPPE